MPEVYCVRADYGKYTQQFVDGGYMAIGWLPDISLGNVHSRDELYPLYKTAYPNDTSNIVIGQQVGQIARFLLEIKASDYVITPDANSEFLRYGVVGADPSYFCADGSDGCPFRHRRHVEWAASPLRRFDLSVPLQNTMRSSLTVFYISQRDEFLTAIGKHDLVTTPQHVAYDSYKVVLDQILSLTAEEFEVLITHLLTALGFEGSEHTGKPGDGGVDATGELNVENLAKIKIFVQAKRYALGNKISGSTVRQLRQAIPFGGQGAFITTADYAADAPDIALETGFPRIGLVNGRQLVDLLVEHWDDIPQEFRERLGLRPGLVRQ
ncbi:MAG: restriction endonuclease [Acidobacteriaceae bacterium]